MDKRELVKTLDKAQKTLDRIRESLGVLTPGAIDETMAGDSAVECAVVMARLQDLNEAADGVKKHIGKVYDWSRMVLVPAHMEAEGLDGMRVRGIGRVSLEADLSASMPDKRAGYAWLEEHGFGDLITETVNASSLKAVLRRLLRDGAEVPEDIFRVSVFTRAKLTRAQD